MQTPAGPTDVAPTTAAQLIAEQHIAAVASEAPESACSDSRMQQLVADVVTHVQNWTPPAPAVGGIVARLGRGGRRKPDVPSR